METQACTLRSCGPAPVIKMAHRMSSLLKIQGHLLRNTTALSNFLKAPPQVATVKQMSTHTQWNRVQTLGNVVPSVSSNGVQLRCASTRAVEGESAEPVQQQKTLFQRFWTWLHDLDDLERWDGKSEDDPAELEEREAFFNRVQAMYFADPPQKPDLQFCRESLEMLMKYDDRIAVETLWNILPELKVEPDDELTERVLNYLKNARLRAYYE